MATSAASQNLKSVDLVPAAEEKDHKKVQEILKKFPLKINVTRNGQTAMHVAARNGDIKMMKILVGNNADCDVTDLEDNTPLHYAVKADKPEVVKHLLKLGVDVNEENSKGQTASQIAFENMYSECMHHFINLNPNISFKRKANPDKLADGSQKKNGRMDSVAVDPSIEKCFYCKEEIATVTFEPCGHTKSCFACSFSNLACPCGEAFKKISYERTRFMKEYMENMKKTMKEVESLRSDKICTICRVNKINCTLQCGHLFCRKCVRSWKSCKYQYGLECWKCFICKENSRYTNIYLI